MKTLICDKENINNIKSILYETIREYNVDYIFISPEFSKLFKGLNVIHDLDKGVAFNGKYLYTLVSETGENLCGIIISNHVPDDLCVFADMDGYSVVNLKLQIN